MYVLQKSVSYKKKKKGQGNIADYATMTLTRVVS